MQEVSFVLFNRQKTGFETIQKSIANKHTSIPKTMSYKGKLNYRLKTDNNTANQQQNQKHTRKTRIKCNKKTWPRKAQQSEKKTLSVKKKIKKEHSAKRYEKITFSRIIF